jgi:hypothetical protein
MARLRAGSHHLMKEVTRVTGCEVRVEGDHFWTTSDGELSGPYRSRTWELRPDAVEMYLPARRPSAG